MPGLKQLISFRTDKKEEKVIKMISKFLIIISLIQFSCGSTVTNTGRVGYDFNNPVFKLALPDTLREISGLSMVDSSTFACIQDENGILFIYDFLKNQIKHQYTFHLDGDYEGIAKVDSTIFILRSDGTLFEITQYQKSDFELKSYNTGIPANNNEGLCYDADNNRLLIACKGKIGKGPEFKDRRVVYGFDLQNKALTTDPVYDFDIQRVKEFAVKSKLNLPSKTRKKKGEKVTEPLIKFRTSAISIHPITKQLFLLSASDYLLFVFEPNGAIDHIEQLNPKIFNKAEGIAFFENGDILITNEGQDKKPTVLRFDYKEDY